MAVASVATTSPPAAAEGADCAARGEAEGGTNAVHGKNAEEDETEVAEAAVPTHDEKAEGVLQKRGERHGGGRSHLGDLPPQALHGSHLRRSCRRHPLHLPFRRRIRSPSNRLLLVI